MIGVVSAGLAASRNRELDFYGRFSVAWEGKASSADGVFVGVGCPTICLSIHSDPNGNDALTTNSYKLPFVSSSPSESSLAKHRAQTFRLRITLRNP